MKKLILSSIIFLTTVLPSSADVAVEELLVRRQNSNVNIRVNVTNPAAETQSGPVVIALLARQNATLPWTTIHVWNNIAKIPSGHRLARDYFDENDAILAELAKRGTFEVRAVVRAPGDTSVEKVTTFAD